jgi:hypothetical protein
VLRLHLVDSYLLSQQRLKERGIEFKQALDLLSQTLANQQLVNTEGGAILGVIAEYARSWRLLQGQSGFFDSSKSLRNARVQRVA